MNDCTPGIPRSPLAYPSGCLRTFSYPGSRGRKMQWSSFRASPLSWGEPWQGQLTFAVSRPFVPLLFSYVLCLIHPRVGVAHIELTCISLVVLGKVLAYYVATALAPDKIDFSCHTRRLDR